MEFAGPSNSISERRFPRMYAGSVNAIKITLITAKTMDTIRPFMAVELCRSSSTKVGGVGR